jgi:CPA1 family monovalent cation:H+ antiporter
VLLLLSRSTGTFLPLAAEGSVGIAPVLVDLLPIFVVAAAVGIFVAKVGKFPYTIALLLAGLAISVIGFLLFPEADRLIDIQLTHDLIFLVLLPPLLFEGAATTDLERLRRNLGPVLALAVVGLIVAVVLLGVAGRAVFGFPLLVALLFASMVLPTDPVSVLALFEELGAPERLSVLVEGESLINDGVGVVLFLTFLGLVSEGRTVEFLLEPGELARTALEISVVSIGGLVVGLVLGYAVYSVMVNLDDHMTEIVLTFVLAYGSFLVAEHVLARVIGFHLSGVIATVVAGLFIGNRGADYAMSPQTKISIFNSLDTAAFLVNTFIFITIGATTPIDQLAAHGRLILLAIPLVLLARAAVVYPLSALVNRLDTGSPDISTSYQHVLVWGGLHGSIPIALVLGLPLTLDSGGPFPFYDELRAMVFGVAAFSLVVQGLTMGRLLDRLGVVTRSEAEELYELLLGRARAVDAAVEAAERLHTAGEIPRSVHEDFTTEYEREKADLSEAISRLMSEHPELRRESVLAGERRVLQQEKSALMDAMRDGVVSDDVGERLMEEVDIKLDRVRSGETTVEGREEGYEEFWRQRAREFGLDVDLVSDAESGSGGDGGGDDGGESDSPDVAPGGDA